MQKVWDFIKVLVFFGAVALLSAFLADYAGEDLTGTPRLIDGDSLELAGQEIRLFGIDAPEFAQQCNRDGEEKAFSCGREAVRHLRRLISGREVECDGWETDKYDRLLATCLVGEMSLNERMVRDGWAVAFGAFESAEVDARRAKRGLWAGDFVPPAQWREDAREAHSSGLFQALKFW